jgi:hypothetical protein
MFAAQDIHGSPLLCTVGSDGSLNLLVENSGATGSGWSVISLLLSFTGYASVVAVDFLQENNGKISLAFVTQNLTLGLFDIF